MKPRILLLITLLGSAKGCASVTGSAHLAISVQTFAKTLVQGAVCEIENDKGKWFITTLGTDQINRSNEDLEVICKKDEHETGIAKVVSGAGGNVAGNFGLTFLIPIVGIVGAVIDHNSGATYKYQTNVQVLMGRSVNVQNTSPADEATTSAPNWAQTRPDTQSTAERFTITADGVTPGNKMNHDTLSTTKPSRHTATTELKT